MDNSTGDLGHGAMRKVFWRILPLILLAYFCAYTDRVNISFAAARMNADLGFSATIYGLGGGLFFLGYALFEIPSNLWCVRFGARRWLARIMVTWGLLSAAMALVATPWEFYGLRFLLGVAEAGFYPGVIFYFSGWMPASHRGRAVSRFYVAGPLTSVALGAVSTVLLNLQGHLGLRGWQWLFIVQGLPSVLAGLALLAWLPESPRTAAWLSGAEKDWITGMLAQEQARLGPPRHGGVLAALRNPRVLHLGLIGFLTIGSSTTLTLSAPLVLTAATHLPPQSVGWIVSLGGLIGSGLLLWAGHVADPRGARLSDGTYYAVALALAFLSMALSPSALVTVGAYLVFAAVAFTIPMLTSSAWADLLSVRELAVGAAAINTVSQIGAFVTPFAWGALKDATGDYRFGLWMLCVMAVGLAAMLRWLRVRVAGAGVAAVAQAEPLV
jgi:MFS transporter, ACS family, tartrate transporter